MLRWGQGADGLPTSRSLAPGLNGPRTGVALSMPECQRAAPADYPPPDAVRFRSACRGESAVTIGHSKDMAARTRNHHNRPEKSRSEQRQRQVMLAARVNSDEERRIREAAKARNVSVASLIRNAVLAAVDGVG